MQICPKCGCYMCYHLEQYHHYYTCACGYDTRTQKVMYTTTTTKPVDVYIRASDMPESKDAEVDQHIIELIKLANKLDTNI